MTKYNAVIYPRGFTVVVDADDYDNAIDQIRKRMSYVSVIKHDSYDTYEDDNLMDEYEICDVIEEE